METIQQRIEKIISEKGMTYAQFAKAIDVQPSNISHIMSGRNNPSLEMILKILQKFPEIRAEWLLMGKGNMIHEYDLFNQPVVATPTKIAEEPLKNVVKDKPRKEKDSSKFAESDHEIPPIGENMESHSDKNNSENIHVSTSMVAAEKDRTSRKIIKIVFCYDDDTFREFNPVK